MVGFVDLPTTQLAISRSLKDNATLPEVISKINEVIKKINFLDEHINFLYERSRTQYNTLIAVQKGLQNVYDEFIEFKKRFNDIDAKTCDARELDTLRAKLDLLEYENNN